MKHTILLSAVFFFILSCNEKVKKEQRPNFLFIVVDDFGYNDLSCMGSTFYETPNIDKIAEQGMVFTDGYATCQVCSPSRASLMSGRFTARHGITDYISAKTGKEWRKAKRYTKLLPPDYVQHLPHEYTTLPEALKEYNYKTFFAGKWHLGGEGSYPEDHGFDENQGGYHVGGPYSGGYFSPFNNPKMKDYENEKGMSLSMKLAQETSRFISENKDSSFLAYLSFYAVHAPIQTSYEKWKKYREKAEADGVAEEGFEMERRFPRRKYQDNPVYAGLIEQMDDAVGTVLKTLKEQGLDKNTIVIFTSDNGGVVSGDNYSTSLYPLRGGKGYQWEGGIRIPYFIHVPWLQHNGQKNSTPVTGADFYPTILDLAKIPLKPKEHIDGKSLLPVLHGKSLPQRPLYWHYPHYGNQGGDPSSVIREGDWKLIHYWEDSTNELYNLKESIEEKVDIADKYPEKAKELSKKLLTWLENSGAKYPEYDTLFSIDSLTKKQNHYKTVRKDWLEELRKKQLSKDWKPNEDWWGSMIPMD